jgi:hypothetical protein
MGAGPEAGSQGTNQKDYDATEVVAIMLSLDKIGYAVCSIFVFAQAAPPDITPWLNGGALAVLSGIVIAQQWQNREQAKQNTSTIQMLLQQKKESEEAFATAINGMTAAIHGLSTTCAVAQAKFDRGS